MTESIDSTDMPDPHTHFWEKISLVAEISSRCRQPRSDGSTFQQVLELIARIVPFDAATLYLLPGETGPLVKQTVHVEDVELPGFLRTTDPTSTAWQSRCRQPMLMTRRAEDWDFSVDNQFSIVLCVPLLLDGDVIGLLNLASYNADVLNDRHAKLMNIIADQFAVSIERSNYVAKIEVQNQALHKAHKDLKAAQKQIIAAEKLSAVAQLAASVNHEINNPLAVILGHIQCLQMENPESPQKGKDRMSRIEQAAMRIGDVNRRLLRIDTLVSEKYLHETSDEMLNLEKSSLK